MRKTSDDVGSPWPIIIIACVVCGFLTFGFESFLANKEVNELSYRNIKSIAENVPELRPLIASYMEDGKITKREKDKIYAAERIIDFKIAKSELQDKF